MEIPISGWHANWSGLARLQTMQITRAARAFYYEFVTATC